MSDSPAEKIPDAIPECEHCRKPQPLCIRDSVVPLENRLSLLILQHPQEQDRALGTARLKSALAWHYRDRHGLTVDPARIAVTTGSSAAFNLAFLSLFDAGDAVAIARPGYPAYRNILGALGLDVVEVPVTAETHFTLTPESLDAAQKESGLRLKGVLLASPANPTGTVTGREGLKALADYCLANSIAFISDEIYHGLTFSGEETSALELTDEAIVINSFSKYYCMTGWRIGWMVLPEELVRPVERIAQNLYISPPDLSQRAAIVAFDATEELEAIKAGYAENRRILLVDLPMGKGQRRARGQCAARRAWACIDGDGQGRRDIPPALPAMEIGKAVRAHDPDEASIGKRASQKAHGLPGVSEPLLRLESGHANARIVDHRPRGAHPVGEGRQFRMVLERIAWGHQYPDGIEFQAAHGFFHDQHVARMDGVETAPEKADAHAAARRRQVSYAGDANGRTEGHPWLPLWRRGRKAAGESVLPVAGSVPKTRSFQPNSPKGIRCPRPARMRGWRSPDATGVKSSGIRDATVHCRGRGI